MSSSETSPSDGAVHISTQTKTTRTRKIGEEKHEDGSKVYIYENLVTWTDKFGNPRRSVYIQRNKYTPVKCSREKKMKKAHEMIGKIVRANCTFTELYKLYVKACKEAKLDPKMIISYGTAIPIMKENMRMIYEPEKVIDELNSTQLRDESMTPSVETRPPTPGTPRSEPVDPNELDIEEWENEV